MIIQATDDTYFLLVPQLCSENDFIAAAKVRPKSYASDLVGRIYSCLFKGLTDIIAEYKRYYATEYKSVWHFLFWHYSVNPDVIEKVREAYNPSKRLFYGNVDSGGDYGVGQYIMGEDGFPLVQNILNAAIKEQGK